MPARQRSAAIVISSAYVPAGRPGGRLPDSTTAEQRGQRVAAQRRRKRAYSAAVTGGPGSLNIAVSRPPAVHDRERPPGLGRDLGEDGRDARCGEVPTCSLVPGMTSGDPTSSTSAPSACSTLGDVEALAARPGMHRVRAVHARPVDVTDLVRHVQRGVECDDEDHGT